MSPLPHCRFIRFGLATLAALAGLALSPPAAAQTADQPLAELLAQQQWPEALAAIDRQLKARPNDTKLLMTRGAVLSTLSRNDEALFVFRKVVGLDPKLPAARNNMAVILAAMGRYEEARRELESAIRLQPSYATAHENLGDLHAHMAAEAYQQALKVDPSLKSAAFKLDLASQLIASTGGAVAAQGSAQPASAPASQPAGAASAARAPASASLAADANAADAAPAVQPASAAGAGAEDKQVETAVRAWAKAWSERDVEGYLAAYVPAFQGGAADPDTWRAARRASIESTARITVRVFGLRVSVDGDRAQAIFNQTYESDIPGSSARTGKTLNLQRLQGRWLIREEIRH